MGISWDSVRLGDYVDSCLGKMLDAKKNQGTLHPYLGNKQVRWGSFNLDDLSEMKFQDHEHERYGLESGDLVVCEGGEPGRCAIWKGDVPDMKIQKALHRIRAHDGLENTFLYYWFCYAGKLELLEPYFTGTTIKHLKGKVLAELEIPLPPLPEQKAIAHILGSLDDKIELNRRMNETLEGMAQALFKSWFVDFDPVLDNAIRAGNPIPLEFEQRAEVRRKVLAQNQKGKAQRVKGKNESDTSPFTLHPSQFDLHSHFPSAFQETDEMGWIPDGWERSTIGEEVDSVGGATPSTKNAEFWDDGDIHWTTPKDLSNLNSRILLDTDRKITDAGLNKISSGLLPVDTVLMSSRAPVGYLALAKVPVAINQGYIAMQCTKRLTPEYVMQWAGSVMDDIKQRAGGTTFAEISKKNFRAIPVIVPDADALDVYSKTVKGFYDKITENLKESQQLEKLRDTLLPKLISGELRIEDAERIVKGEG